MATARDWGVGGCGLLLAGGLVVLACLGFVVPLEAAFRLAVGWVTFLIRVLPQTHVSGPGALTATVCLAGLAVGGHLFLRWACGEGKRRWRPAWTLSGLGLVVLMFVAGISAVGITHQTAWLLTSPEPLTEGGIRSASARLQSMNNLKQIALAAHNYHDASNRLPPGGTFDARGRGLHGWQTLLLPYVEQETLYKQINLQFPWDHPQNRPALATLVRQYLHPVARPQSSDGFALSHYAGNVHVLGGDRLVTLRQIEQGRGMANTLLAGEAAVDYKPWGHPANWRDPGRGLNRAAGGFGSPSSRGAQFVMADGSVRFFNADTDPEFLQLLAMPAPAK
jgi:hypothetical protein